MKGDQIVHRNSRLDRRRRRLKRALKIGLVVGTLATIQAICGDGDCPPTRYVCRNDQDCLGNQECRPRQIYDADSQCLTTYWVCESK